MSQENITQRQLLNEDLLNACRKRNLAHAKNLIIKGADVNAGSLFGWTALMEAAVKGHTDIVQILLTNGADVNVADSAGWTALREAVSNGYTDIVQLLLTNGADVNVADVHGRTALTLAVNNNSLDITIALLKFKTGKHALELTENIEELYHLAAQEMMDLGWQDKTLTNIEKIELKLCDQLHNFFVPRANSQSIPDDALEEIDDTDHEGALPDQEPTTVQTVSSGIPNEQEAIEDNAPAPLVNPQTLSMGMLGEINLDDM